MHLRSLGTRGSQHPQRRTPLLAISLILLIETWPSPSGEVCSSRRLGYNQLLLLLFSDILMSLAIPTRTVAPRERKQCSTRLAMIRSRPASYFASAASAATKRARTPAILHAKQPPPKKNKNTILKHGCAVLRKGGASIKLISVAND